MERNQIVTGLARINDVCNRWDEKNKKVDPEPSLEVRLWVWWQRAMTMNQFQQKMSEKTDMIEGNYLVNKI